MSYNDLVEKHTTIESSISYSKDILSKLKQDLDSMFEVHKDLEFTIITTGSFGRLEASVESDMDLFIFCDKLSTKEFMLGKKKEIEGCINKYIKKEAGDTGTFGAEAVDVFDNILANIGGNQDTNQSLTRRMLFLLEGKAIYNELLFDSYKKTLINKYLNSSSDGRIDKYLLNDIIRYYRTITTDFQHKVDADGKSWGTRNIKLRFSRKLLYFAGIMTIATASDQNLGIEDRVSYLSSLLESSPLERIFNIANESSDKDFSSETINEIFSEYEYFLLCLSSRDKRDILEDIKDKNGRVDKPLYLDLSERSTKFTNSLYQLLKSIFPPEHQIHTALIF
ncbi:TPA: hypothetical protein QCI19_003493 [Enterobacter ludwigii]|nr:hypothetical protein [Enterobacter ludwigii]